MNRVAFGGLMREEFRKLYELQETKGADYSGDDDALHNFKAQAQDLGLTDLEVWGVLAGKHWSAIMSYVRNGGEVKSEPIEGRIRDLIVYSFLLMGLIAEREIDA